MSKIEVNTIAPQCGTTVTVGEGAGQTVAVDAATVNLGRSGGTVNLTCGATQSGFGRTGTVDWDTRIHTGTVTAATGKGYFVNTTSGGITVNLPAAAVGSIVAVSDYASTADSNNITVSPNGSEKINGVNDDYKISTKGLAVTLVYADATKGWKSVTGSDADATGVAPAYVAATGGNATVTCGDYKVHAFTAPGTLCVSNAGNACGSNTLDYLVVAGGGGSRGNGGGAGAGGFRVSNSYSLPAPLTSPLATPTGITAAVQGYPITVGAGAAPAPASATGSNSSFTTITSAGGGMAGGQAPGDTIGGAGGSGGGGDYNTGPTQAGGAGNTPPVSPSQGNNGGPGAHEGSPTTYSGGGGGGAGAVGTPGPTPYPGGQGGIGSYISPAFGSTYGTTGPVSSRYFAGGGGSDSTPGNTVPITGGAGGGGDGGGANSGTVNTGGGAGGAPGVPGNSGGSGIVLIRYKFQN